MDRLGMFGYGKEKENKYMMSSISERKDTSSKDDEREVRYFFSFFMKGWSCFKYYFPKVYQSIHHTCCSDALGRDVGVSGGGKMGRHGAILQ